MNPEIRILVWWLAFGGTHLVGSLIPVRNRLIAALGLPGFKALYSVVSFATFIPLCWVYAGNVHAGDMLFPRSPVLGLVAEGIVLIAFLLLVQALMADNPITTKAEMAGDFSVEPTGVLRITRHPLNTSLALLGLGHALANPFAGDVIFWGGFLVYGVIGALHQDARKRADGPDAVREFLSVTSAMPFAAILSGRQPLKLGELKGAGIVVSLVLFALLRTFHASWFGGFGG